MSFKNINHMKKKQQKNSPTSISNVFSRVYGRIAGIGGAHGILELTLFFVIPILLVNAGISGQESSTATIGLVIGISILLNIVVQCIAGVAVLTVLVRDVSFKESIRIGFKRWYGIIPISILTGLITIGGIIAFILPGIYIAVRSIFAYLIWIEGRSKGAWAIIKESFALVGGATKGSMFWKLSLLLIVLLIAVGTTGTLIEAIFGEESITGVIISVALSSLVIAPVFLSVLYALYESAKELSKKQYDGSEKIR